MSTRDDAALEQDTERWFIRRGLPMFVENYSATEDVFTRAYTVLLVVFVAAVLLPFPVEVEGWSQLGLLLVGIATVVGAIAAVNRLRGRSAFAERDRVGRLELVVFVVVPPLIMLVVNGVGPALGLLAFMGGTLLVVYVVTRYALLAALQWAVSRVVTQLSDVSRLVTRALPLMLLFITFLFINTEVWQVAGSLEAFELWLAIGFFAAVAVGFLVARLPDELEQVETEATREFVVTACAGTPLAERVETLPDLDRKQRLAPRQERNLMLVTLFTQLVQAVLVAIAVWAFFIAFGAVAIKTSIQESWLGAPPDTLVSLWSDHAVTRELFRVSTFIGGFAGLYFTVYALTDATYRSQFLGHLLDELGRLVGVRRAYLALRRERRGEIQHTEE